MAILVYNMENVDDQTLLELIDKTMKEWKKSEKILKQDGSYVFIIGSSKIRTNTALELYQSLLKEAKRRNLTLSSKQLLGYILHSYPY